MIRRGEKFILDNSALRYRVLGGYCVKCKYLKDRKEYKCKAFDVIPETIWNGDNDHIKPYPGDNGIQFEPAEEEL